MNVFISGGCKNGKSMYAQKLAKETALREGKKLYYVATMRARDMEDENRIKRHRTQIHGELCLQLPIPDYYNSSSNTSFA